MQSRRQRTHGTGALLPPSVRPIPPAAKAGANGHHSPAPPSPVPASPALTPAMRPEPVALPPEALNAFAAELTRFSRTLDHFLEREKAAPRSGEDRKETWVLLSALAVVAMFCFVAFYLNQSELRDLHSNLQDEIDRAAHTASSSVERALGGFHLERLPQTQAELERFLKEKDRRDAQRWADLSAELERQSTQTGGRFQEELRSIQDQLEALRQLAGEMQRGQNVTAPAGPMPAAGAAETTATNPTLNTKTEARGGWVAGTPDGGPAKTPPVPAARPPGPRAPEPPGAAPGVSTNSKEKNQTGA